MENKESLRQYFLYNKNIEGQDLLDIFLDLDYKLSVVHNSGYIVDNLNSDNIVYEEGFNFSSSSLRNIFTDEAKRKNIRDLAKLNIGAQISIQSGFSDFTVIDTSVIVDNFDAISSSLVTATQGDDYLKTVLLKGSDGIYYNDYLFNLRKENQAAGVGMSNSLVKVKSTEAGRAMALDDKDAAFVNVVFYPILIVLIIISVAVILTLI